MIMVFKNKKGITLIALVVTIVVLLILAGVAIQMLSGDNGILNKAVEAREKSKNIAELENIKMASQSAYLKSSGIINARDLEIELGLKSKSLKDNAPWEYKTENNNYIIYDNGEVRKLTATSINITKMKQVIVENNPQKIIFTNIGAANTLNDIGDKEGEIYTWIENETMYISGIKKEYFVRAPKDCSHLFYSGSVNGWQTNITEIDCTYLDVSNTSNLYCMFWHCSNLVSANVSNFNTKNVTGMLLTFQGCKKLKNIDIGNWNTENVENMQGIFAQCQTLEYLNINKWNTSKVKNMQQMFQGCSNITSLDVSSFNTKEVKTMYALFDGCAKIKSLDLHNFNTKNVINMNEMFHGCKTLEKINISDWDTTNVNNMLKMFLECNSLKNIDISSFNTSNVTDMRQMFQNCYSLEKIYISNLWSVNAVTKSDSMFGACAKLPNYNSSLIDKSCANAGPNGYLILK